MLLQNWVPVMQSILQKYVSYGCLLVPGASNVTSAWHALLSLLTTKLFVCYSLQSSNLAHQSGSYMALGSMRQGHEICKAYLQDSIGNWGGSLILSTTTAGSSSSSTTSQPVDRLTIDSSGLATFTAG